MTRWRAALAGAAAWVVCGIPVWGAPFHFAIVSDRTGRAVPGVNEEVWREVASAHPDFIVTVGDAIEGLHDAEARSEWESVKRSWPTNIPVYHTPGNHDIWDAASERLYVEETGRAPHYSFDYRNAHFVVLDNSRTENLSTDQVEFLKADLQRHRSAHPIFVFFHRNFWLLPLKLRANNLPLLGIAHRYGVCCIVSGHGHQLQSVPRDGVEFLELGSSGANIGSGHYRDGWFYQYCWVTVDGGSVSFEVRELGAPYGQGRTQIIYAGEIR